MTRHPGPTSPLDGEGSVLPVEPLSVEAAGAFPLQPANAFRDSQPASGFIDARSASAFLDPQLASAPITPEPRSVLGSARLRPTKMRHST